MPYTPPSITAGSAPLFLTKNYVNGDCTVAVSSGEAYKHRAYDMTRASKWTSLGTTDGATETYKVTFKEGGTLTSRTLGVLAFLGINWKRFKVEYSIDGGATFPSIFTGCDYTAADFSGTDLLVALPAELTVDAILITITTVQNASLQVEKELADLVAAALMFQPSKSFVSYDPSPEDNIKTVRLHSGLPDEARVFRSDSSFRIWRAHFAWRGVSEANGERFDDLVETGGSFVFIREPGDRPKETYVARFVPSSYRRPYLKVGLRSAGSNPEFDLEEARNA